MLDAALSGLWEIHHRGAWATIGKSRYYRAVIASNWLKSRLKGGKCWGRAFQKMSGYDVDTMWIRWQHSASVATSIASHLQGCGFDPWSSACAGFDCSTHVCVGFLPQSKCLPLGKTGIPTFPSVCTMWWTGIPSSMTSALCCLGWTPSGYGGRMNG